MFNTKINDYEKFQKFKNLSHHDVGWLDDWRGTIGKCRTM
jgi:hypothetical protein